LPPFVYHYILSMHSWPPCTGESRGRSLPSTPRGGNIPMCVVYVCVCVCYLSMQFSIIGQQQVACVRVSVRVRVCVLYITFEQPLDSMMAPTSVMMMKQGRKGQRKWCLFTLCVCVCGVRIV
jgi:hypothetical protein